MNWILPGPFGRPANVSLLKVAEGGSMPQHEAIRLLRQHGIPAYPGYSPYVGHYGIELRTRNRRLLARAGRLL